MKWIYKITYPNGKIYVGMDLTGTFRYFGSPDKARLAADFAEEHRLDFTIRRQILHEFPDSEDNKVVRAKEVEEIRRHRSNDPAIGYNRWPKFKPPIY